MAERIRPFGIHHCGDNLHKIAPVYAELPLTMVDVGWGSDVAAVREALPETFLNLRLNPVRMLTATPQEIAADTEGLLSAVEGSLANAGICCINMDYGTPDENIFAMYEVVQRFRRMGNQVQKGRVRISMTTPWDRFMEAAHLGEPEEVPVALIVDSPWLPGYAGINTLDYFLYP